MSRPSMPRPGAFRRLLAVLLLSCWAASAGAHTPPPIHAASEYDYPPFALVTKEGQADGFAVDLLRAALQAMGHDVDFKVGPWHEIKQELADGRIQVLPLVARTKKRDAYLDFTVPYLTMHGAIVVRKGDYSIHGTSDLSGKEVIVMKGDIAEEYVHQHGLSNHVFTTETLEQALRELASGHHDAVVLQKLAAQNLIRRDHLDNLKIVGPPLPDYQFFCFAVREGNKRLLSTLNEGLALTVADGSFQRLKKKWLGPIAEQEQLPLLPMGAIAIGTLLLAWGTAYLWQRSLQERVRVRTAELSAANEALAQEIAERVQAEDTLRRYAAEIDDLYNRAPIGYHSVDSKGVIIRMNDTQLAWLGYTREEVIGKMTLFDLGTPESRERGERAFVEFMKNGWLKDLEIDLVRKDGSILPVSINATVMRDSNGRYLASRSTVYDNTERKRVHDELARHREQLESLVAERTMALEVAKQATESANERLQRVNRELEQFAYVAAHDLKAPLRAVSHLATVLREEVEGHCGEEVDQHLEVLIQRVQKMYSLIDGMLTYARAGHEKVPVETVETETLLREIIERVAPDGGITIHVDEPMPVLHAPRLHLEQVFHNLMENAIKHHDDPQHGNLWIYVEEDADACHFHFCDDGPGIEASYHDRIFQMFQTLNRGDTTGTGIGLALVAKMVAENSGTVTVRPREPKGVCFTVTWPR